MKSNLFFLFLITLLLTTHLSQAQWIAPFAIIKDKDGFTYVRSEEKAGSKIIDTLRLNQVFEDLNLPPVNETSKSDWHMVTYGKYGVRKNGVIKMTHEAQGYIHKSRIQYLKDLPQLKKKIQHDSIKLYNDSIQVIIVTGKFITQEHKMTYEGNYVRKIDGEEPWGIDGMLYPKTTEIKSIKILLKNKEYSFPKNSIHLMLEPNSEEIRVALSDNNTMFLSMSNSDAAGAYNVVWTIQNGMVNSQFINRDF
ncbi:MAG: hypothetical protein J0I41_08840 [Filimonas sp.]|nr:hypothetical protein [Filimonas sp.]